MYTTRIIIIIFICFISCNTNNSNQREITEKNIVIGVKKDSFSFNKKSYHLNNFEIKLQEVILDSIIYNDSNKSTINLYIDGNTPVSDIQKVKKILIKNQLNKVKIKVFK